MGELTGRHSAQRALVPKPSGSAFTAHNMLLPTRPGTRDTSTSNWYSICKRAAVKSTLGTNTCKITVVLCALYGHEAYGCRGWVRLGDTHS